MTQLFGEINCSLSSKIRDMQVNRMAYARSITPVDIPVDMMQKESTSNEERPHCKYMSYELKPICNNRK